MKRIGVAVLFLCAACIALAAAAETPAAAGGQPAVAPAAKKPGKRQRTAKPPPPPAAAGPARSGFLGPDGERLRPYDPDEGRGSGGGFSVQPTLGSRGMGLGGRF